jgi:hypothetical protein
VNALFDTNVPIYWRGDNPRFRFRLKVLIAELRRKRATLFLSVVSLQEILIFSRIKGTADADCDWLAERFNFLPLTSNRSAVVSPRWYASSNSNSRSSEATSGSSFRIGLTRPLYARSSAPRPFGLSRPPAGPSPTFASVAGR